ncbi:hypothetical protein EV589_3589 [Mycobacterium sp. BK558]|nr:hypothetical protein EV589_3589 [Mycobacterium sp. BK558]
MNAGCYVGRIGGLAVALGVGAAVFTGHGVAYADSTGAESSAGNGGAARSESAAGNSGAADVQSSRSSTENNSGADSTSSKKEATNKPGAEVSTGRKDRRTVWSDLFASHKPKPSSDTDDPSSAPETPSNGTGDTPADGTNETPAGGTNETPADGTNETPADGTEESPADDTDKPPQQGAHDPGETVNASPKKPRWSWKPAEASSSTSTDDTSAVDTSPTRKPPKSLLSAISVDAPHTATTASTLVTVSSPAHTPETTTTEVPPDTAVASTTTVSQGPLVTLFKRFLDVFSGNAPVSPTANSPFAWLVAAASRREIGAAAQANDPTMVWNGYKVVAVGKPTITSFYGKYTMVPAFPGVVQGQQDFKLVDPKTGDTAATFHGLVAFNNDLGFGNRSLQIVVTDITSVADGVVTGVKPGDIPPVGSIFASVGNGRNGTVYSALAREGKDVVSYKWVSSAFSIPLNADLFRRNYSAADFLTDYEGINRPIYTTDGYYIAPVEKNTMVFTGFTGYEPFFNAIQGTQTFGLYDKDTDELIGKFEGVVTVTSDFWGTTSEAIIVTEDYGDVNSVGVKAGQIPPEGSVYNIIYWRDASEYALYYSKPQDGKDLTKTLLISQTRRGQVVNELPINFNASDEPDRDSYTVGGYTLKPTSEIIYTGVNGLPPREVIVQGYQQFDVFDAKGNKLGSVDADVSTQWDISRGYSKAILVTDINDSISGVGTAKGDVPPVGSVFNFKYTGNTGFGEAYYSMPSPDGDKVVYQLRTPFGAIPLLIDYNASKGLADYDFYTPFGEGPNMLSAAGAQSGALLGASQPLCVLDGSTCEV